MVQFVETWLLADPDALAEYFGDGFRRDRLPTTNLEQRTKADVEKSLRRATEGCLKGPYAHGQAHQIIEFVRPASVKGLVHGKRLFETLDKLIKG